jgi:Mg-chelatase subunit ChlD
MADQIRVVAHEHQGDATPLAEALLLLYAWAAERRRQATLAEQYDHCLDVAENSARAAQSS